MVGIDNNKVMELRKITGCGVMRCKEALGETSGNIEEAVKYLREKGLANASKKASRATGEGVVHAFTNDDKTFGIVLEINCETDFVAKNDQFKDIVITISNAALLHRPKTVENLLDLTLSPGVTAADYIKENISILGENIVLKRYDEIEGYVESYVHSGNKIAVLASFSLSDSTIKNNEAFTKLAKDICMHIAAMNPRYKSSNEIGENALESEKQILRQQTLNEGKPESIVDKIVSGRMSRFYKENCLLEQEFIKNPEEIVEKYIKRIANEIGSDIKINSFIRYERGN